MAKVSADLELRTGEAFAEVDRLEAALQSAVSGVGESLGAQIQAAITGDYQVVIEPEVDTTEAEAALEAAVADAGTATIDVDADIATLEEVAEAVAAIDGETVEIDVNVDEGAGQGLDDLTGKLDDLKTQALGAAAATFGLSALFADALGAQGALESFNLRVGEFADEVNSINVGGLNEDLGTLAIQLGSSDEEALGAAASLFQVGEAAGIAGEDVATTTDQIVALAARAVALNPELGSLGSAIEGLTNGLARGGRFLANYGLSLSVAEINARALADTGKDSVAELELFEKTAAGAAIASERLGDTLGADVAAGAENAQIRLRSLEQRIGEISEQVGAPLVEPLLASFDALATSAEDLTPVMADLAAADVEVAASLVDVVSGSDDAAVSLDALAATAGDAADTGRGIGAVLDFISEKAPLASATISDLVRTSLGPLDSALRLFEVTGGLSNALTAGRTVADAFTGMAETAFRAEAAVAGLTDAEIDNVIATSESADGVFQLEAARQALSVQLVEQAEETVSAAEAQEQAAVQTERAQEKAARSAALVAEQIDAAGVAAATALEDIGQSTIDAVGVISTAFDDLNEDGTVSLYEFTASLEQQVADQAAFLDAIGELQRRGASDLALALFEQGQSASSAAQEAAALNDEQLADREAFIDETNRQNDLLVIDAATTRAELVSEADGTRKDVEKALQATDLAGALEDPFLAAELEAEKGGERISDAIIEGYRSGALSKKDALKAIAEEQAQEVVTTWREVLGIFSPSKVFEDLGAQTIAGFVAGVEGADAAARDAVDRAIPAIDATATIGGATNVTLGEGAVQITVTGGDTGQVVAELEDRVPRTVAEALLRTEVAAS